MSESQKNHLASLKIRRTIFICFSYVMAFITGLNALVPNAGMTELLLSWTIAFSLVIAVALDARIVGKPVPGIVQFLMLITWPVSIPICLIWTRKWQGFLWIFAYGFTLWLAYYISAMLVYYFLETKAGS